MLRFAPSPTGDMHIGNLRVALFNYIVAKQKREKFIIRIEDTDKERNIEGKDREILEILHAFGVTYDDVLYQSHNLRIHWKMATKLLTEQKAFSCFCKHEEIEAERKKAESEKRPYRYSGGCHNLSHVEVISREEEEFAVRLKKLEEAITFKDEVKGDMTFTPFDVDSFIILRTAKDPTYNFACAIDDMLADISLVIRGEDHVSNTPKQVAIRDALGYNKEIRYAHLPIILNNEGKKMSKRDKASSVKWLLEEGFLPSAIANYLIHLGNKTPKEIFTLQEAIGFFDLSLISKTPAKFDMDKLRFINRKHLKEIEDFTSLLQIHVSLNKAAKVYLEEASTLKELKEKLDTLTKKREIDDFMEEVALIKKEILSAEVEEDFEAFKKRIMAATGLKGKKFFMPLRMLLSNAKQGPELKTLFPAIRPLIKEFIS